MIYLKITTLITLSFFFCDVASGKNGLKATSDTLYSDSSLIIKTTNVALLRGELNSSAKDFKVVGIFTNHCGGTPYLLKKFLNDRIVHETKAAFFLVNSSPISAMLDLVDVLHENNYTGLCYMIDSSIPDSKKDSRTKGTKFRNRLYSDCKSDIIGVPYYLLVDKAGKLIMHGYPNFRGPLQHIPSDFLPYYIKQSEQ